jgi:hypothetical protein
VKKPPQQRLKALSQVLQRHRHPTLEQPDIPFDPCVAAASLSLHSKVSQGIHAMVVRRRYPKGNRSGSA